MSTPILSFSDASIAQRDKVVFQGVNFEMLPGDFVFLIGKREVEKVASLKPSMAIYP